MESENFNLTKKALADLHFGLENLHKGFSVKKNACLQQKQSYKYNLSQKNEQIEKLQLAVLNAQQKIGSTLQKIDMVLEENGTGNDTN